MNQICESIPVDKSSGQFNIMHADDTSDSQSDRKNLKLSYDLNFRQKSSLLV